ncbi:MAG: SAM-dependent methyltransferase [Spirochaetes bacterium GWD1_61_31]|nr:MAG: SAM-dependent methyltransferase [Spirochaetes bacterium GWB1_60_80]OHD34944.1 MAG: SAM-dependent methyltransferase [Spirochaetes bacterium GWC1_61_12]OHD37088.1 MAG: SAM-dependent methyltransferase [Spirochaetes bacterium GWD1_61_31]OHD45360.1 MAG: SAM-dependent methyltransferase [Spirochaetes bacterium GWE1_60_18]OHD61114.1 MAG: SAM-dependent methyltransferase [Spirochaetes bacterium GWF1_60_12]
MNNTEKAVAVDDSGRAAWNGPTYQAWVERFGPPEEAAKRLVADPAKSLATLREALGDLCGRHVLNLMGSHGHKAVAMALLGARVTVADFSAENRRYALELATAASVSIDYLVADVLKLGERGLAGGFDLVLAEMGILHYFRSLEPFMALAASCLRSGGRFVLRDFHPVSTKLLSYRGSTAKVRKYKVDGDYFSAALVQAEVAYSKHLAGGQAEAVWLRQWTLGETVTAVAGAGLVVVSLSEEPNLSGDSFDKGIPKTFTLVAAKAGGA